jgi:tRNA(Arg) A34 adenosine deaminase TadA
VTAASPAGSQPPTGPQPQTGTAPLTGPLAAGGPRLDAAWARALELAWEAFLAATTPVGAVVVDGSGVVVAEGRNRRSEVTGPVRQLMGSRIAHAEVNALARLQNDLRYTDHLLLTTLEPCGMCHGAALQSTVGGLAYAAADPYAGTGAVDFGNVQASARAMRVTGPLDDERGWLAGLLHIAWLAATPGAGNVLATQRAGLPELTALACRPAVQAALRQVAGRRAGLDGLRTALHPFR